MDRNNKRIALIYRKSRKGRFSIEGLFTPLESIDEIRKIELPKDLNSIGNLFRILLFSFKIKERIIHVTGDVHFLTFILFWKKSILTIHDLNYYEDLRGVKKYIYGFLWFYLPIKFSNIVTVISPSTKMQLTKYFKISSKKIVIIPNWFEKTEKLKTEKCTNGFEILCIGRTDNKNFFRLIKAIENIDNLQLNIIGNQPDYILRELEICKICFSIKSNLSKKELDIQYNNANMLFFASLKEGFGLPILEAQSIGLPVLTSNTTSMPFVAGKGAVYVNPYSIEDVREKIIMIKDNLINLNELIENGFINQERFLETSFKKEFNYVYDKLKLIRND